MYRIQDFVVHANAICGSTNSMYVGTRGSTFIRGRSLEAVDCQQSEVGGEIGSSAVFIPGMMASKNDITNIMGRLIGRQ